MIQKMWPFIISYFIERDESWNCFFQSTSVITNSAAFSQKKNILGEDSSH